MRFRSNILEEVDEAYEEVEKTGKQIYRGERAGDLSLLLNEFALAYGANSPDYHITEYEDFKTELDFMYRDIIDRQVLS